MIVERSMHPAWLSNAYLIADREGGTGVFVDSGAPLEPLHEAVERLGLMVTHLLTTHADADHVAGDGELRERYGLAIVKGPLETGGLSFDALPTPGHKDDHLTFVCNREAAFTGDVAIAGGRIAAVGGKAGPARRDIDAAGLLVTPGWVDVHTHYDGQAMWDPLLAPSCWHGVTTTMFGNCGVGFAPVKPQHRGALMELMNRLRSAGYLKVALVGLEGSEAK